MDANASNRPINRFVCDQAYSPISSYPIHHIAIRCRIMSMLSIISIMEKGRTYSKDEIHNLLTDKGLRPGSRDNTKSTIYKMVRKGKLIRVDKDCYKLPDNQN